MKRGSIEKTFAICFIVLISLSFVSAGFFSDLFKALTGYSVDTGDTCTDTDGQDYYTAGTVTMDDNSYDDVCTSTDVVKEYYCLYHSSSSSSSSSSSTSSGANDEISLILSLFDFRKPKITGKAGEFLDGGDGDDFGGPVVGDIYYTVEEILYNCQTQDGVLCSDGKCGCSEGSEVNCGVYDTFWGIGICHAGTQICSGGTWGECYGEQGPLDEVCGGALIQSKDQDCDDIFDPDDPDADDWCEEEYGVGYECILDGATAVCENTTTQGGDCTPGTVEDCTYISEDAFGICTQGQKTCTSLRIWGQCTQVVFPQTESPTAGTCNDGLDNDCDGEIDGVDSDCSGFIGVDETCNGVDEDGDGVDDQNDPDADEWCEEEYGANWDCIWPEGTPVGTPGVVAVCSEYVTPPECTDADGDGYATDATTCDYLPMTDCDDTNDEINPDADEVCDGVDNDCDGLIDEAPGSADADSMTPLRRLCGSTTEGVCTQVWRTCEGGGWDYATCQDNPGFIEPSTDGPGYCDGLDNNCDGNVDEGCACDTNGQQRSCDPGVPCKTGTQTCTNSVWGDCEATGDVANCNVDTACNPGLVKVCGTNVGICTQGYKECGNDGSWGSCLESVQPNENEICSNNLDDNCDGRTDEASCIIVAVGSGGSGTNTGASKYSSSSGSSSSSSSGSSGGSSLSSSGSSSSGGPGSQYRITGEEGFFSRLLKFFLNLFYVGRNMLGFSISEAPVQQTCTDTDGGKNFYTKGSGTGLSTGTDQKTRFEDFCYKGELSNTIDKCGGEDCFLKEYSCDGNYIKSDAKVVCEYGCLNGACIPDASLSDDCYYFDKSQWKWVNNC